MCVNLGLDKLELSLIRLSIVVEHLVYNLFSDRQRNISIHRYIGCPHEIEFQIINKYGFLIGRKNRLDKSSSIVL